MILEEATKHYKRQCEHKRIEVLCSLLKKGDRVLDVGCGIGAYTSNPLSYLPINIVAIDRDKQTIEYAQKHNQHINLEFIIASGETYKSEIKFDLVICSHVIEHMVEPRALLHNMSKLIKDNGALYLGLPNGYGWFEIQNYLPRMMCRMALGKLLIGKMMGIKDTLNMDSQHVKFFTYGNIKHLLIESGWQIVESYSDELLGGIILDRVLALIPFLAKWNVKVADRLPNWLVNGWIFVCKKA